MELDFRHPELLANPIHLLAVHIAGHYRKVGLDVYNWYLSVAKDRYHIDTV